MDELGQRRNGPRWKLVGNAVTVDVAAWVASRLVTPGDVVMDEEIWDRNGTWPKAAWGESGKIWSVLASEFPKHLPYRHLLDVVDQSNADVLSHRAAAGFWNRLQQGNLGRHPGFREDIVDHIGRMGTHALVFLAE